SGSSSVNELRGLVTDTIRFSQVDGPGNRFVVFLQGCNFDCLACHNPHTIPMQSNDATPTTVDEILDEIREVAPFISGVTVSGGEATLQHTFVRALFAEIKADDELIHLTTLIDTNGSAAVEIWDELADGMDGAMVDLKAFDSDTHQRMTTRGNDRVLSSIKYLADIGKLHEVRLMIVPGENDSTEAIARTAEWLHDVDPDMSVKLIGYRPHGVRPEAENLQAATHELLDDLAQTIREAGLDNLTVV
ncbi:MAG: radical SAM protein, partial [Actinomycetota bacterium]